MSKKEIKLQDNLKQAFEIDLPLVTEHEDHPLVLEESIASAINSAISDVLSNLPQEWLETAPVAIPNIAGHFPDASKLPETLPAIQSKALSIEGADPIKWRVVGKLPSFIDPRIQKLGNMVFESFPCYQKFAESCKEQGIDPHFNVRTISDFTNGITDVLHAAKFILEHGSVLDLGRADFGDYIPDYNPDIAIFLSKDWTFKLVRERIENGAPVNANYIYAWPGGRDFYHKNRISNENRPALAHET